MQKKGAQLPSFGDIAGQLAETAALGSRKRKLKSSKGREIGSTLKKVELSKKNTERKRLNAFKSGTMP